MIDASRQSRRNDLSATLRPILPWAVVSWGVLLLCLLLSRPAGQGTPFPSPAAVDAWLSGPAEVCSDHPGLPSEVDGIVLPSGQAPDQDALCPGFPPTAQVARSAAGLCSGAACLPSLGTGYPPFRPRPPPPA